MKRDDRGFTRLNLIGHPDWSSPEKVAFLTPNVKRTKCAACLKPLDIMTKFTERDGEIVHIVCD
jgi:hypothetical protein